MWVHSVDDSDCRPTCADCGFAVFEIPLCHDFLRQSLTPAETSWTDPGSRTLMLAVASCFRGSGWMKRKTVRSCAWSGCDYHVRVKVQEPPQIRMDCMTRGSEIQLQFFIEGERCVHRMVSHQSSSRMGADQLSPDVRPSPAARLSRLFEITGSQPPLFGGLFESRRCQPPLKDATQGRLTHCPDVW